MVFTHFSWTEPLKMPTEAFHGTPEACLRDPGPQNPRFRGSKLASKMVSWVLLGPLLAARARSWAPGPDSGPLRTSWGASPTPLENHLTSFWSSEPVSYNKLHKDLRRIWTARFFLILAVYWDPPRAWPPGPDSCPLGTSLLTLPSVPRHFVF